MPALTTRDGGARGDGMLRLARPASLQRGREGDDARMFVDVEHRDMSEARSPTQLRDHPRREQRVATEVEEEVVADGHALRTE